MQMRAVMYTPGGSRRSAVSRELKNSPYTYTGHQIDINTGNSSWNAAAEEGCAAKTRNTKKRSLRGGDDDDDDEDFDPDEEDDDDEDFDPDEEDDDDEDFDPDEEDDDDEDFEEESPPTRPSSPPPRLQQPSSPPPRLQQPSSTSEDEAIMLPVCDSNNQGLAEPSFLSNLRKLSTVQWGGRAYTAPANLNSMVDVHEKVGSKIAAMLSVIRDHPKDKHVVIVSKYGGDTNKAYKKELGFALHTLFQSLGEGVMGYKWAPMVSVQENGDKVTWDIVREQPPEGAMGYALYLTQMPRNVLKKVKKKYNDRRTNFGGRAPSVNVIVTNRVEGLSLQTTSFVHLLDAPVSSKNYFQAIGRAIRFCSAKGMDDRRVFVYEYFGTVPVPLPEAYEECFENAVRVELALDHLHEKFGGARAAFHLTPPTVAGVPLKSFDTSTKTIAPKPTKSAIYTFEGFQGDLGALNGKRFVHEDGTVVDAPVPAGGAEGIIYGKARSFHTGDQIDAIAAQCDDAAHSNALNGLPRDASGGLAHAERLRGDMDRLASAEALYRNTGKHHKEYQQIAERLGLKTCKRDDALTGITSHERRVMAIVAALSSGDQALGKASDTFESAPPLRSSTPTHLRDPAMNTFRQNLKPIDDSASDYVNVLRKYEKPLAFTGGRRGASKKSKKVCIYDDAQPAGGDGGKKKKKAKGLSVETDSLLTRFAGVRYGNTRKFTMAIAANAVDCLLFERFHAAREGAMYGGLTCSGSRKESDR